MNPQAGFQLSWPFPVRNISGAMNHKWAEFFLQGCEPHVIPCSNQPVRDPLDFKEFQCHDAWEIRRRLRDDMPGLHSIMVLELEVNGVANLVVKTVCRHNKQHTKIDSLRDSSLEKSISSRSIN